MPQNLQSRLLDSNVGYYVRVFSLGVWKCGYYWALRRAIKGTHMSTHMSKKNSTESLNYILYMDLGLLAEDYCRNNLRIQERSDNETYSIIQSSEEHLMERATKVGNIDVINYVIGYNNTDTGLATVCIAPNHLLTLLNVSSFNMAINLFK